MIKKLAFLILYLFIYCSLNSQTIGQTKKYIIKKYETCKIVENQEKFLAVNCDGIDELFHFDENGLCKVYMFEIAVSEWNYTQVDMLLNNGKFLGKSSSAPLPKKEGFKTDALIYSDDKYDYFFYNSDFEGNTQAPVKAISVRKSKS